MAASFGDGDSVRRLGQGLLRAAGELSSLTGDLSHHVGGLVPHGWSGDSADAFSSDWNSKADRAHQFAAVLAEALDGSLLLPPSQPPQPAGGAARRRAMPDAHAGAATPTASMRSAAGACSAATSSAASASTSRTRAMADLTPLRIGVTGSRYYASLSTIRAALLSAHERARPHKGHVLIHGQCDPYRPGDRNLMRWDAAKELEPPAQARLLGADWLAEWVALTLLPELAWEFERYPASWRRWGHRAGPIRNRIMVGAGAGDWLVFQGWCADLRCPQLGIHGSHGITGCADLAEQAGIPVWRYPP